MSDVTRDKDRSSTARTGPTPVRPRATPTVAGWHASAGNQAVTGLLASPSAPVQRLTPTAVAALQASGGNRAVTRLLASSAMPVQRLVETKPSDLDRFIGAGDTVKNAFGRKLGGSKDSFVLIRRALSDYRNAAQKKKSDPAEMAARLAAIDSLCTRFINDNRKDTKRLPVIARLQEEISSERATVSKQQAGEIYQSNVKDTKAQFGFKALTSGGKLGALDHNAEIADPGRSGPGRGERISQMKAKYGLSDAEVSAISLYSAGDFSYINPVTANIPSYNIASQKKNSTAEWARHDDRTLKEEGGLHAGMATQGLQKMEPFKGETYRGSRHTPEDFRDKVGVGKVMNFPSLASSSKDKNVSANFIYGIDSGTKIDSSKTVGVLWVITDGGGRDISGMAIKPGEAEVLIMAGSAFKTVSVTALNPTTEFHEQAQKAADSASPLPDSLYLVRLVPTTEQPSKTKDTPWEKGSSATAADPAALPAWAKSRGPGAIGARR